MPILMIGFVECYTFMILAQAQESCIKMHQHAATSIAAYTQLTAKIM